MIVFEASDGTAEAAPEPWISTLDIFIIGLILGLVAYWYKSRETKKDDSDQFRKLTVIQPSQTGRTDTDLISKMKKAGRNVIVFYGSQTGTAEEFATRLAKDSSRYGMKGIAVDPEECDMDELPRLAEVENILAIFCMATYGEGDPTDNAQEFNEWLHDTDSRLEGVKYAVFGLGNKTYEHYNATGIYVDKRLEELGAERVFELGLGDDDGSIEEDFVAWVEKFWPAVCEKYGVSASEDLINMRQFALTLHDAELGTDRLFKGEHGRLGAYEKQKPPFDSKNPYLSSVAVNRELHKSGDRSCMHIELDISGSRLRYEAGDHVAVYPVNDPHLVETLGKLLGADLDQAFSLVNVDDEASKKHPFPCPTTYRTALSHYLDITSPPRTNVLRELAEYTDDEKHQKLLRDMATAEGKDLYHEWILEPCRTVVALLEDIPSIKPPIDHICELLPKLQPRYYSISSSPKAHSTSVHITAVLTQYKTSTGRTNNGVATSWLKLKQPTNGLCPKVPIYIRKSQFRLPFKHTTPVIMIGPGTGFAPFRGFLQERNFAREQGKPIGETVLYFGCRKKSEDYIYEDELQKYVENGTLSKLKVAFSRDQAEKVYVQHLLKRDADDIWRLLEAGCHIYVCGDARNMAGDVRNTLLDVLRNQGGMSSNDAEAYAKRLQSRGRYALDVWS